MATGSPVVGQLRGHSLLPRCVLDLARPYGQAFVAMAEILSGQPPSLSVDGGARLLALGVQEVVGQGLRGTCQPTLYKCFPQHIGRHLPQLDEYRRKAVEVRNVEETRAALG